MSGFTAIDTMCATIRARLLASNVLTIVDENGDTVHPQILDRDEDPRIIADSPKGLPAICVIPIGDKEDSVNYSMGSYDKEHNFSVVIAGYYRATDNELRGEDIYDDIATLRKIAYDCSDLFAGAGAFFTPGVVHHSRVELGYFEVVDYVIYRFVVTLNCKIYEV
jgi:hypothetical protein